jgi:GNAT superfamily N-acetyltransferase
LSISVPALRNARPDELEALVDLCLRSKAVWGYDAAFLAACRDELTLTSADLTSTHLQVLTAGDALLGVVQIVVEIEEAHLLKLFVEPGSLRMGFGKQLLTWAIESSSRLGARRIVIEADPDAVPFYQRNGAMPAGFTPSESVPGRLLPRLVIDL